MQNGEEPGARPGPPLGAAGSSAPETVSSSHGSEESASLVPSRPPLQSPFLPPPNGRRTTMFATSPTQNTTTAVPAWVPDALVSHTQNSEYLAELLDLSVTAGNAAVFSTIRTLHGMSSDESWEYAEAMRHADNVSETLRPYLTHKHLWLKLWVEARRLGAITSPPPDQSPFGGVDLSRRTSASWTAPGAASPHQPRLPDFESERGLGGKALQADP